MGTPGFRIFIVGMISGTALGLAAGVLLAPQSGQATRRQLWGRAEDLGQVLSDTLADVAQFVEKAGSYMPSLSDREGSIRKKIEELRQELEELQAQAEAG